MQVKLHLEAKKAAEDQLKAQLDANKKLTLLNNLTRNKETKKIASEKEQVNEKLMSYFVRFYFILFFSVGFSLLSLTSLHCIFLCLNFIAKRGIEFQGLKDDEH